AVLVGERHLGAAFGKAGHPALPFAGNAIATWRIEVGEADLALPACLDRSNFDGGDGLEFVIRDLVELLAAGDAALEHLGVVELGPDHFAAGRELDLPIHRHRHRLSPSSLASRYKASAGNGESAFATARHCACVDGFGVGAPPLGG